MLVWSIKYICVPLFYSSSRKVVSLYGPGGMGHVKRTYKGEVKLR